MILDTNPDKGGRRGGKVGASKDVAPSHVENNALVAVHEVRLTGIKVYTFVYGADER